MRSDLYTAHAAVVAGVGKRGPVLPGTRGARDDGSEALPSKFTFTGRQLRPLPMTWIEALFIDQPTGEFHEC